MSIIALRDRACAGFGRGGSSLGFARAGSSRAAVQLCMRLCVVGMRRIFAHEVVVDVVERVASCRGRLSDLIARSGRDTLLSLRRGGVGRDTLLRVDRIAHLASRIVVAEDSGGRGDVNLSRQRPRQIPKDDSDSENVECPRRLQTASQLQVRPRVGTGGAPQQREKNKPETRSVRCPSPTAR